MKQTKSRKAILSILHDADKPLTAMEILRLDKSNILNLSTIYRALIAFEAEGIVRKDISAHSRDALYSLKEEEHGHIIECIKCHKHVELDYCPFDEANREIEKKTGFAIEDENHIIYGVCADCRQEK